MVARKYLDLCMQYVVWPINMIRKIVWLIKYLGIDVEHTQRANSSILPFSKEHM